MVDMFQIRLPKIKLASYTMISKHKTVLEILTNVKFKRTFAMLYFYTKNLSS